MLKKTIQYHDLDGNPIVEDFYFNLSKAELAEMELSVKGGMKDYLQSIIASEDGKAIIAAYKDILRAAYGRRSADNKSFIKSEMIWQAFEGSEAYSILFVELVTDAAASAAFINGIMPADLVAESGLVKNTVTVELPKQPPVPSFSFTETQVNQPLTTEQLLGMSTEEFAALQQRRMERPS